MAFRKKDIKKASYYVWFLGVKESQGLRGEEFVLPVLRYFLDRESRYEPSKVTLQVSSKGLKIIQNVPKKRQTSGNNSALKMEQIKHLIPHHAITCVIQEEDIICCILLIYNPMTKCPVHVHAYRCDSKETATSLRSQLQILIDRPENQKKFREIENRLIAKGLVSGKSIPSIPYKYSHIQAQLSSDGRSTRTEGSDRTEDSFGSTGSGKEIIQTTDPKVVVLYESLAAELKAKLGNPKAGPILLPPKDYDTITRKHGKLKGIEARKSTNTQIVGSNLVEGQKNRLYKSRSESSGKSSSGIGSDEALPLSSETSRNFIDRYHDISSEEEINCSPVEGEHNWSSSENSTCLNRYRVPSPVIPKLKQESYVIVSKERKERPLYYFPRPECGLLEKPLLKNITETRNPLRIDIPESINVKSSKNFLRYAPNYHQTSLTKH